MANIPNENEIINNNYLEEEDLDNYISSPNINKEIFQNNEMNINNLEFAYNENNINNNIGIDSTQEAFIQTLNLQIKQLQELLQSKNKEFDILNAENNKLKLVLIQEQKKIIDKENNLHSINIQKNHLEEQLNKYKIESESMQSKIKELNYKLIELNQNIISKENLSKFNNKIKDAINNDNSNEVNENKSNIINEKYEIELKRLNNLVDELEIKNNKLIFDNKAMNTKLANIISDKNSQMSIYKSMCINQINNLNKIINNLNNRLIKSFSEKIPQNFLGVNNFLKKEILEKFNELENKLNTYDKENCDLRKENQKIKSELEELKLVGDSKEKIIQKLQTDFEKMESEYNNTLFTTQKIDDNLKKNDLNKSQYINELIIKQNILSKENKDLKYGLRQMTKNIDEANKLYFKKKAELDKTLELRDNKLKEYRAKIALLKTKINELHKEINILKEYKGDFLNSNNNQYSFFTQNNNDLNNNMTSQLKKEQRKMRCYTPKVRGNRFNNCPFEINLENKISNNNDNNNIFGDIKISEIPKEKISSIRPLNLKGNDNSFNYDIISNRNKDIEIDNLDRNGKEQRYLQEYKDTLKKIDEQLKQFKS